MVPLNLCANNRFTERGSTIAWLVSPYDEVNQAMAEALSRERVSLESNNQG
jgi:hypothetical protein